MKNTPLEISLENSKIIVCTVGLALCLILQSFSPIFFPIALLFGVPLFSCLLLSKNRIFAVIGLAVGIIPSVFLHGSPILLFCILFIGGVQYFCLLKRLTKLQLIIAFCLSAGIYFAAVTGIYYLLFAEQFKQLLAALGEVFEQSILSLENALMKIDTDLSAAQVKEYMADFAISFKLYLAPVIIAVFEIIAYLGLLLLSVLLRRQKTVQTEADERIEYVHPIDLELRLSKISAAVYIVCYVVNFLSGFIQNAFIMALSCVFLILLPFFVFEGIKDLHRLLYKKTPENASLFCVLICVAAVILMQFYGISLLGFFGFWRVITPDSVKAAK